MRWFYRHVQCQLILTGLVNVQIRKGPDVPPGYDPVPSTKPKTKAAKKNEKRKEKKQQVLSKNLNFFLFAFKEEKSFFLI